MICIASGHWTDVSDDCKTTKTIEVSSDDGVVPCAKNISDVITRVDKADQL